MSWKNPIVKISLIALIAISCGWAQGVGNLGENVNIFDTTGSGAKGIGGPFKADTMYFGGPFLRDTSKNFHIWFEQSTATWNGILFLMYTDGTMDTLIANHPGRCTYLPSRTEIDITQKVKGRINHLDTVTFMYLTTDNGNCSPDPHQPRYTGPNRSPLDKNPDGSARWSKTDRFWSPEYATQRATYGPLNNFDVGRRYSVAGWIPKYGPDGKKSRSDTAEFAFEDGGDMSFNDIRYKVTGLFLIRQDTIESIQLDAFPNDSIVRAGDSILYHAVMFGRDSLNKPITYPDDSTNKYVRWELIPDNAQTINPPLRKGAGPSATNVFFATEAYETFTVKITVTRGKQNLSVTRRIRVIPGKPDHLVIEGNYTGTGSLQNDNPLPSVTIGAAENKVSVYAVLRDFYGNYISADSSTTLPTAWSVIANPTIVSATNGVVKNGEGVISKLGPVDTAIVQAKSSTFVGPLFTKTVKVNISITEYDSLRVINAAGTTLSSLGIKLTQDTLLIAQGRRKDGLGWVNVPADWLLSPPLASSVPAPGGKSTWDSFTPTTLGTGTITIKLGALNASINVSVQPGGPDKIELYRSPGDPKVLGVLDRYDPPTIAHSVTAGSSITMYSKMSDPYGTWLSQYEIDPTQAASITWTALDSAGNPADTAWGTLTPLSGNKASYAVRKAYHTVLLVATFKNSTYGPFRDTVKVTTKIGRLKEIVIEGDSVPNLNYRNPLGTITLPNNSIQVSVFGILRDEFENFYGFADSASWFSRKTLVVTAQMGPHPKVGEGVINRITRSKDSAFVLATFQGYNDSVKVYVVDIFYTALRIVNKSLTQIDSLAMTTNDDTTLMVQGRRSDNAAVWESVNAKWEMTPGLSTNPDVPALAGTWSFSPNAVGKGIVRVTMGIDNTTKPDTMKVNFLRGDPILTTLTLITPPEKLIAGDTISALVTIRNKDGLVPGSYCYPDSSKVSAIYIDALNGGRLTPVVSTTEQPSGVLGSSVSECFNNGIDTVKFVLYYAPSSKDAHKLTVTLGNIHASTDPFVLLPGALDSIAIEDQNNVSVNGPDTLYAPTDFRVYFASGFDRFGNRRGPESGSWTTNGTLTPINTVGNRIYISSQDIIRSQIGNLTVTAQGLRGAVIDVLPLVIVGPAASIQSACTRDINGNGYLDRIDITFNKPITIPAGFKSFIINRGSLVFIVDSVGSFKHTQSDSQYHIYLHETPPSNISPQTSWLPYVSFSQLTDASSKDKFPIADSAAPVVWYVEKVLGSSHAEDVVNVHFSEKIADNAGSKFTILHAPDSVLSVWRLDEKGQFVRVDSMLASIPSFIGNLNDTMLSFKMTNDRDLTSMYWMNIRDERRQIADNLDNYPEPQNKKVRVVMSGQKLGAVAFPNPASLTLKREPAGFMQFKHNPSAAPWVLADNAGAVIQISVTKPNTGTVTGYIKIYDLVGNLVKYVNSKDISNDLFSNIDADVSSYNMNIYWNGSNDKGMLVAPGIYRVVVYLDYSSSTYHDTRLVTTLGIAK